ncbi:MAG: hypothetical protein M0Z69_14660 [Actinomycetota bacterium]|nr:hypothetical protein [Actinomycetota bacterium]
MTQQPATSPAGKSSQSSEDEMIVLWFLGVVAFVLCVPLVVTAAVTALILRSYRIRAAYVAVAGGVLLAVVLLLRGGALYLHSLHALWMLLAHRHLTAGLVGLLPVGLAGGVLTGAGASMAWDHASPFAPPSAEAAQQRRKQDLGLARRVAKYRLRRMPRVPAERILLGVRLAGANPSVLVKRHFVAPSKGEIGHHGVIAGASGTGKTTTGLTLAEGFLRSGGKLIFIDGKSSPRTAEKIRQLAVAQDLSYLDAGRSGLAGWRGGRDAVLSKLIATQNFADDYWRHVASSVLRYALSAPGWPEVQSFGALIERLDRTWLLKAWRGNETVTNFVLQLPKDHLAGLAARYHGVAADARDALDGSKGFDDADVVYLPLGAPGDTLQATAVGPFVLEAIQQWALAEKAPDREVLLMCDEFSRIAAVAPAAVDLVERLRESGVGVWYVVQDSAGLGPNRDTRQRILGAVGQVIVHRLSQPEDLANLAGTGLKDEVTHQLDEDGPTGRGSHRIVPYYLAHPQDIRQLLLGEAVYISAGAAVHFKVAPSHEWPRRAD